MGVGRGEEFENFSKEGCFLSFQWWKQNSPLLALPRKTSGKIHKKSFRHSCTQACKITPFLSKLCCITPSGNTVQQHQCGKQAIAGWQSGHGVFCQTLRNPAKLHNILQIILTKFCNILFIKRFSLTMNPILIVLLNIFRQNSKVKNGGQAPSETNVGWPRPMRPPVPPPMVTDTFLTERFTTALEAEPRGYRHILNTIVR